MRPWPGWSTLHSAENPAALDFWISSIGLPDRRQHNSGLSGSDFTGLGLEGQVTVQLFGEGDFFL